MTTTATTSRDALALWDAAVTLRLTDKDSPLNVTALAAALLDRSVRDALLVTALDTERSDALLAVALEVSTFDDAAAGDLACFLVAALAASDAPVAGLRAVLTTVATDSHTLATMWTQALDCGIPASEIVNICRTAGSAVRNGLSAQEVGA